MKARLKSKLSCTYKSSEGGKKIKEKKKLELMHKEKRIGWFEPGQSNMSCIREKEIVFMHVDWSCLYRPSAFMVGHERTEND